MQEENENKLFSIIKEENIKCNFEKLNEILVYIKGKYENKKRYSSITIYEHCIGVACEVAKLRLDEDTIYAALLHETIKLEDFSGDDIEKIAGIEVLNMVKTVERLSCLNYGSKYNKDVEILRKMFLAIGKDIRAVIIKLIDRLYNMKNIFEMEEKYRQNMAKESLYIYAPIAHRLGMSYLKSELEDISFRVLYEKEYMDIKAQIDEKKQARQKYIEDRIKEINQMLRKENIKATVYGRPKHFYSIYRKIKQKNCKVDDLFDLLAIRVIVDSIKDCYSVLGLIHDKYKPLPGRFKDYIALPKTNMYQSLHTTVFGEGAKPFEVQIRTWDMHRVADYGIAAHFAYKEKKSKIDLEDKKIIWLRKLLEVQQENKSDFNDDNISKIKSELFGEEVFVFTPKGDIIPLPKGSTIIDFAYMIHQKVAEKMIGAKINSRIVPISTKLQNTDIVEIITSDNSNGPSIDWLKFVKTSSARNKITSYLKKNNNLEYVQRGKEAFEKEIKRLNLPKEFTSDEENIENMLKKNNFNNLDECFCSIGFGSITVKRVVHKLLEIYEEKYNIKSSNVEEKKKKNVIKNDQNLVIVKNIDNCLVKFAKCCNPILGDEIVGYITNSNGVSIHRKDCKNLGTYKNTERKIDVKWREKIEGNFETKICVYANTCDSVLTDIILKLKELKINVNSINSKSSDQREMKIELSVVVPNNDKLQSVIKMLRKIDAVYDVGRIK